MTSRSKIIRRPNSSRRRGRSRAKASSILAALIVAAVTRGVMAQTVEREEWSRQVGAARESYDAFAARAVAAFRDAAAARRGRPRVFRLDDPTLRPGDIVVTPTSLLLFKGSTKHAYDEADFERLDELRARRLPHARDLRAILRRAARGRRE
jgi:hypothetical protein